MVPRLTPSPLVGSRGRPWRQWRRASVPSWGRGEGFLKFGTLIARKLIDGHLLRLGWKAWFAVRDPGAVVISFRERGPRLDPLVPGLHVGLTRELFGHAEIFEAHDQGRHADIGDGELVRHQPLVIGKRCFHARQRHLELLDGAFVFVLR